MWNDSDRLGYDHFLGYKVKNNLFIVPHAGEKGSVWYSQDELSEISKILESKFINPDFESEIISTLDKNWLKLKPYLIDDQKIKTADELLNYYKDLVEWWSAMNTVFGLPDMDSAPKDFRDQILSRRTESEKYTEKANKVFVEFWNENAPQFKDLISVLIPEEAADIVKEKLSQEQIMLINERLRGCFMYNRQVYPLDKLESILKDNDLMLERVQTDKVMEIKGRTAQPGKATGVVKIIRIKADTSKISPGDILVTEMTNPDYVPYMKIAGAIVTDEGGATCHAAIASRELKIPCIVGTRIATRMLKDGDMVEVDADRGIVRII